MATLGIFAKWPQPGRVKTRLAAAIGAAQAAEIYAAFLTDVLERHRSFAGRRIVAFDPPDQNTDAAFRNLAGPDYEYWPQPDGDLGERLNSFFETFLATDSAAVAVGADSPTMPAEFVARAVEMLGQVDCVLGPGADGGYYLIGLRQTHPDLCRDVDWGTAQVLFQTAERLKRCGLSLGLLPIWNDVDTVEDLHALSGYAAASEYAGRQLPITATRRALKVWEADGSNC